MNDHVRQRPRIAGHGTIAPDLAHTTQDDAFHEIQLNGKQLFFLFMAATVVSVVIFLCGVLVGRGVRTERGAVAEKEALSTSPMADAQPSSSTPVPPAAGTDLTVVPPPPPADDVDEVEPKAAEEIKPSPTRAEPAKAPADKPSARDAKAAPTTPPPTTPAPTPAVAPKPVPNSPARTATASAAAAVPAASGASAAAGDGWVVQVAALNARDEANAVASRYNKKGYVAYVADPRPGTSIYRVRIGFFSTQREANAVADKLRKDGEKPWVTR